MASVGGPAVASSISGQSRRIAGQTGGRMGERHNAMLVQGDFDDHNFRIDGLHLDQTIPLERLRHRRDLLWNLNSPSGPRSLSGTLMDDVEGHRGQAYSLLKTGLANCLMFIASRSNFGSVTATPWLARVC
jgi:hypothetical protein